MWLVSVAAAASLAWFGVALNAAGDEVAYRTTVAGDGKRVSAVVVEEGVARPDGGYAQAWVETSDGDRAFVDLADSRLYVSHVGEQLTVVLPPAGGDRDVALPPDVLAASHTGVYAGATWAPAVCVLVAVGAGALCFGRPRRWRSASTRSTSR